jgi:uncharacterized protein YndB with AHSA1/START domain
MPDIIHRVGIRSSSTNRAYEALTTHEGLKGWWTGETSGKTEIGGVIHFAFGPHGFFDMQVLELDSQARVLWQVVDGPPEWVGTTVSFELKQEADFSIVLFKHQGWRAPVEFMHHCSTKWAIFLMSLKSLVESGKGAPYPNDVLIDNWR